MVNQPGTRQIILLEFNELCPPLLDKWIGEGKLPNFARFRDGSQCFLTTSDESEAPNLEPWVQWYSVHTGLGFDQHQVFHLADGPLAGHEDIWQFLSQRGLRVGNFGSMNAGTINAKDSFYVADPWCSAEPANPAELQIFQDFVAQHVKEYSHPDHSSGLREAVRFGAFMLGHGLTTDTIRQLVLQLAGERSWDRGSQWKRATLLDRLQLDVFMHLVNELNPAFATFFSNSTAHYQHAYWRYMDPRPFSVAPAPSDLHRYKDAVLYGYQRMDALLARLLKLERRGATLVFATALSQQPFLRMEALGGQRFYRPRDVKVLLGMLGVHPTSVEPTMTHQFNMRLPVSEFSPAREALASLRLDGRQVMTVEARHEGQIYFGCGISQVVPDDAVVSHFGSNAAVRFHDLFYLVDGMKSGRHHPDGVLWIKTGFPAVHKEKASILDVFPTIVALLCGAGAGWTVTREGLRRRGRNLLAEASVQPAVPV